MNIPLPTNQIAVAEKFSPITVAGAALDLFETAHKHGQTYQLPDYPLNKISFDKEAPDVEKQ